MISKITISEETTVAQNNLLESKNAKVAQVNSEASSSSDSASSSTGGGSLDINA